MKRNILFIYNSISYVKSDYLILSKHFNVNKYEFTSSGKILSMLKEYLKFFFYLIKNIGKYDIYFIWFADYHSFPAILISKIFRKKSILNLGGYDVTYIPELNYGAFNNPFRAFFTKFSIRNASINLAVAKKLKDEALQRVPKANIKVLHTGYDVDYLKVKKYVKKEKIVLTTSKANNYSRFKIKGLDFFGEVAKHLPEYKFIAIGIDKKAEKYFLEKPDNLEIYPMLPLSELLDFYRKAKVYAQFSIREGFPSSICEAMLLEDIPISTDVGASRKIIGDTGFILKKRDVSQAVKLIKKAMQLPDSYGEEARKRIVKNFNLKIREENLLKEIENLFNKQ